MTYREAIHIIEMGDKIYIPYEMRRCQPEQLEEALRLAVEALEHYDKEEKQNRI